MEQTSRRPRLDAAAVALRAARLEDREAVLQLQEDAFAGEELLMTHDGFADVLAEEGTFLTVADIGGRVAGYCLIRHRRLRPWAGCDFLCVGPEFSGNGIGGRLLVHAFGQTARPLFRLFVKPSNQRAVDLYRRLGFKQAGRRKTHYANGEDALVLMKLLWPRTGGARGTQKGNP